MLARVNLFFLSEEEKTSKSTGDLYQAINFLDEKDNKFFAMGKGLNFESLQKFDKVVCDLDITLGQYTRIEVLTIKKVS